MKGKPINAAIYKLYKVLRISGQIQLKQPGALKDLWRKAHREQTEYEARLKKLNDLLARAKEQTLEVAIEALLEEIQEQLDESQKYHDRDKPAHYRKVLSKIRTSLANLPVENTPEVQKNIREVRRQLVEIADYIYKKRGISMLSKIKSFKLEQEEEPVFLELEQHLAQIEAKERPSRERTNIPEAEGGLTYRQTKTREQIRGISTMPIDLNDLNGPQRKIVRDAFLAAFNEDSLNMVLQEELDKPPLLNLVSPGSFEIMVFNLINVSKRNGWSDQLIAAAELTSGNVRIKKLRETLERSAAIDLFTIDKSVTKPGGLERLVREDGGFADWGLWIDMMTDIGRRICRVEYQTSAQIAGGTGFLVAPNLVLTNYHVVERHILGTLDPAGIRCRFDFAIGSSGSSAGLAFPLAPVPSWLVDHSPYSPHDPGDLGGLPQPDQLDYALLRLASAVGDDIINGEKRGCIPLMANAVPLKDKSIVFIGQHPELNPLKLAVGITLQTNQNGTRVRYDANTERGSSGSPCLNAKLELVALHHGGDPDYSRLLGDFNQGIPSGLIAKQIAGRNVATL